MHPPSACARDISQMQWQFIAMSLTFPDSPELRQCPFNHFLCEITLKTKNRNETKWPAHRAQSTQQPEPGLQWHCKSFALRYPFVFGNELREWEKTRSRFEATKRKTGSTISLHSPSNIDTQLYFTLALLCPSLSLSLSLGMRFTLQVFVVSRFVHIEHASPRPAAHIAHRNYYVLRQRVVSAAVACMTLSPLLSIRMFYFILHFCCCLSVWFFHLVVDPIQRAPKRKQE